MLRNVVYLLSQRSAITVRASRTWWPTAHTKLLCSRPSVLREDRKRSRSLAPRLSRGRRGEGTPVPRRPCRRRLGPRAQNGRPGPLQKLPPRSQPQHPKNKAKRGLLFKKGKRHNPSSQCTVLFPWLEVYLMQAQGNSIPHTAAGLGFLTTVEEL